ncbi:AzlC family ABC transporter permease [Allonocardiopsis opalescens]|uniref:Putative branched-subunit amino acid permease n=1 Tax=Allonocardiopsis opalescens TaxID=1144618 RepID=A0A2T0Q3X2_9ACTN|nr:AzlC family ABC transporter permease [Allonocardiopsis opalescens]PRX98504.1 putative branched-subunit amino acid permease [Allonocardiopsis opalescens]
MSEAQPPPPSAPAEPAPRDHPSPVRSGLAVGLAVGPAGIAFGTAATTAGLDVWQTCVLSLLAFTGASQFALIGVVAGGGSPLWGGVGALLLGARNTLYGLRLADLLQARGPLRRLVAAHGVIDETTAVAIAQPDPKSARTAFAVTYATLFALWNATTALGAVAADRIGDPDAFGLDAVGPAIFLALLWPQLTEGGTRLRVALGGAAILLATTAFLPPGVPVLLAAAAAAVPVAAQALRTAGARPSDGNGDERDRP